MNKINRFVVFLFAIFILTSCGSGRDNKLSDIKELEKIPLYNNEGKPDKEQIDKMIKAYEVFSKSYPEDSLAVEFLFSASRLYVLNNDFSSAIGTLDIIIDKYKSNPRVPDCIFSKANIYETNMHDLVNARKNYELLIKEYPNHPLTDDAKILLENLGKSPEDLLQTILANQQNS